MTGQGLSVCKGALRPGCVPRAIGVCLLSHGWLRVSRGPPTLSTVGSPMTATEEELALICSLPLPQALQGAPGICWESWDPQDTAVGLELPSGPGPGPERSVLVCLLVAQGPWLFLGTAVQLFPKGIHCFYGVLLCYFKRDGRGGGGGWEWGGSCSLWCVPR